MWLAYRVGVTTVALAVASYKLYLVWEQVFMCGVHVTFCWVGKNLTIMHLRNGEQRVLEGWGAVYRSW